MKGLGFTIGEPQEYPPPPVAPLVKANEFDWGAAYRAANRARGQWVPITCEERIHAKNLSLVARRRHGLEAIVRGAVCWLRVPL